MKTATIPIKTALRARSINTLNGECVTKREDFYFCANVTYAYDDLKRNGHCYCQNKKEVREIERRACEDHLNINIHHPIINGEEYDYMWEIEKI